jgi:hypothetical protein
MIGKRNLKSLCLFVLLIAEAMQGLTPDLASVSSARLVRVIDSIAAHDPSCAFGFRTGLHVTLFSDTTAWPNECPWQDSEPDEVCLASFPSASKLAEHASGDAHSRSSLAFDPIKSPVRSICHSSPYFALSAEGKHSLIHSICRLTC